jgi:NAD(P)-dependent dehydrogenase (short-subunit alcohol dehydrogenase family)
MVQGVEIFSLRGKTALVTGATGHLGAAMARVLSAAGAHVLVNSRSSERGGRLAQKLVDSGGSAESVVFDVTDQSAVDAFFAGRKHQALHILINNAYFGGAGSIELSTSEPYANSYEITVLAAHNLVKAALPCMRLAVSNSVRLFMARQRQLCSSGRATRRANSVRKAYASTRFPPVPFLPKPCRRAILSSSKNW